MQAATNNNYFQKPLKVNQSLGLLLGWFHSFLSLCTVSFQVYNSIKLRAQFLPALNTFAWLGNEKESIASAIYDVQEGLFTLLAKSTVVTPWNPKNVPDPLQHPDWVITLQENSSKANKCLQQ